MPRYPKIIRYPFLALAWIFGGAAFVFMSLVFGKVILNAPPAQAASALLYPKFCLGGWNNPQAAAGAPDAATPGDPDSYTAGNSAVLESPVYSQIFCGYFGSRDRTNPPKSVTVAFAWTMKWPDGQPSTTTPAGSGQASTTSSAPESLSSSSGYLIATSTGLTVPATAIVQQSPTGSQNQATSSQGSSTIQASSTEANVTIVATTTISTPSSGQQGTSTPQGQSQSGIATTTSIQTPPPAPKSDQSASSTPTAQSPAPATTNVSSSTPAASQPLDQNQNPTATTSTTSMLIESLFSLIASTAHAQSSGETQSSEAFLLVSYSIDGIRWTTVGTVGADNWKDYEVSIPVSSWSDLAHLQIMLSPLPTLDKKPDIYLDGMAAAVSYDRTVGEAISDATAAAADAVNLVADVITGNGKGGDQSLQTNSQTARTPQNSTIIHKKLLFASAGSVLQLGGDSELQTNQASDSSSFSVSGPCAKKYFVILLYKNASDFRDHPSSFIANEAHECSGSSFSFDLKSLSTDIPAGNYYLMAAEEGDTGPWTAVSRLYPISIQASTTVETISE